MQQINFRVTDDERQILDIIAEEQGISIAELTKQTLFRDLASRRIDIAFKLLSQGKIGRKRCLIISGLSYHEFMIEWNKREAQETLPESMIENELKIVQSLDIKKFRKI